jgi:hypothetical protein
VLANDSGNAKGEMGRRPQQGEDKPSSLLCLRIALPGSSIVGARLVLALWWGGRPGWGHGMATIVYLSHSPTISLTGGGNLRECSNRRGFHYPWYFTRRKSSPRDTTLSRLTSLLERHGAASAVLLRAVIDQARCSHVFTGVPHCLVDGELVFGLPSQALAQQDLA